MEHNNLSITGRCGEYLADNYDFVIKLSSSYLLTVRKIQAPRYLVRERPAAGKILGSPLWNMLTRSACSYATMIYNFITRLPLRRDDIAEDRPRL